jgi:hypothetical protein
MELLEAVLERRAGEDDRVLRLELLDSSRGAGLQFLMRCQSSSDMSSGLREGLSFGGFRLLFREWEEVREREEAAATGMAPRPPFRGNAEIEKAKRAAQMMSALRKTGLMLKEQF